MGKSALLVVYVTYFQTFSLVVGDSVLCRAFLVRVLAVLVLVLVLVVLVLVLLVLVVVVMLLLLLLLLLLLPVPQEERKLLLELTWDPSRDDDNVCALERFLDTVPILRQVSLNLSDRRNMREVGGDTWGVDDVVESELVDERTGLEQKRQWLTNAARGTRDDCSYGDFCQH